MGKHQLICASDFLSKHLENPECQVSSLYVLYDFHNETKSLPPAIAHHLLNISQAVLNQAK